MFSEDSGNGAGNLLTFLFGIAVGVAGTFVYAALNEEQFHGAVSRTKALKGKAEDTIGDYLDQADSQVTNLTASVQDKIDDVTNKTKKAASDAAGAVEAKAHQAKREINS